MINEYLILKTYCQNESRVNINKENEGYSEWLIKKDLKRKKGQNYGL